MNELMARAQALFGRNGDTMKALMAPIFIVMILSMMVLPLPAFALDIFFTFNIALALTVMLVAAHMVRPLDFAAFPSVLLITTLLRLSLNVASTRVVLMQGPPAKPAADDAAAPAARAAVALAPPALNGAAEPEGPRPPAQLADAAVK